MAGGWRISEADELSALRKARHDARTLRTEEAWTRFALQVARCEHLGLLDDVDEPPSASDVETAAHDERAAGDDTREAPPSPRRYAAAD